MSRLQSNFTSLTTRAEQGVRRALLDLDRRLGPGGWVSITPSWSDLTLGTGATNAGEYRYVPGGMWIRTYVVLGTSPTVGAIALTIPNGEVIRATPSLVWGGYGVAHYRDAGTAVFPGRVVNSTSTSVVLRQASDLAVLSATAPFMWVAGDYFSTDFTVPL